jgi:hypothetical protein
VTQPAFACTPKIRWILRWFVRDFGHDAGLFARDEGDQKALLGLSEAVPISHTTMCGRFFLYLERFAPAVEWEELSATLVGRSNEWEVRDDVQPRADQSAPALPVQLPSPLYRWLPGEGKPCGADVNPMDSEGRPPLQNSAGSGHLVVVEYLVAQKADVNAKNHIRQTILEILSPLTPAKTLAVSISAC